MSRSSLEKRVATLEAELAQLKDSLAENAPGTKPWWEQIWGSFAGDPAFLKAMQLGRKYRESQRPKASGRKKK